MKAAELRALFGKRITWTEAWCSARGGIVRKATVLEVVGKNVLVDTGGMTDWKWAPDMRDLKAL
jgi:hypothetical protein